MNNNKITTTVYKIKRKSDGFFSTGGSSPRFNNKGKVWKKLGHLNSHLSQIKEDVYKDCEIVFIIIEENIDENNSIDLNSLIQERKILKQKKDLENERKLLIHKRERHSKSIEDIDLILKEYK